jgi:integrase
MPRGLLTDLTLRKTVAAGARLEIWDTKTDGFGVRISETGRKVFFLVYRHRGHKRRLSLGVYGQVSLSEARDRAIEALIKLGKGIDPAEEQQERKLQFNMAADVKAERPTFGCAVADFLRLYAHQNNKASTINEKRWLLQNTLGNEWANRAVADITRRDVVALLDRYVEEGKVSGANHILTSAKTFFTWCLERELVTANPCAGLRKPGRMAARERVLVLRSGENGATQDELALVWQTAKSISYPYGTIVLLLVSTAQRRNEVAGLRWNEIDWELRLWRLPKERTKNGLDHTLPLSNLSIEILKTVPRINSTFLFPARGNEGASFSGFSKAKAELDEVSGVAGWTLHDLRRTAATRMAKLGVAPHVIEKILNHVSGTFAGVAGVYNQHDYESEMRRALDLWASELAQLN